MSDPPATLPRGGRHLPRVEGEHGAGEENRGTSDAARVLPGQPWREGVRRRRRLRPLHRQALPAGEEVRRARHRLLPDAQPLPSLSSDARRRDEAQQVHAEAQPLARTTVQPEAQRPRAAQREPVSGEGRRHQSLPLEPGALPPPEPRTRRALLLPRRLGLELPPDLLRRRQPRNHDRGRSGTGRRDHGLPRVDADRRHSARGPRAVPLSSAEGAGLSPARRAGRREHPRSAGRAHPLRLLDASARTVPERDRAGSAMQHDHRAQAARRRDSATDASVRRRRRLLPRGRGRLPCDQSPARERAGARRGQGGRFSGVGLRTPLAVASVPFAAVSTTPNARSSARRTVRSTGL